MYHQKSTTRVKLKVSPKRPEKQTLRSPKRPSRKSPVSSNQSPALSLPPGLKLHTRNLLTAYVNHNKATSLWITTVNTDPNLNANSNVNNNFRGSHLQAFSFRSEHEARESAYVNAPPMMVSFDKSPNCFQCDSKFNSVFRRPAHCRNCGVCICSSCSSSWNKLMVPGTYNTKGSKTVKVCKTCDYLSVAFRRSLLDGNYDAALKVYMTGNINLRCPFFNVRSGQDIMLPIHCAASGGNLKLLSWLVDVHHCPLKMTNTGNRNSNATQNMIKTSRGRTVLEIAIDEKRVQILQYLVNQKRVSVSSSDRGKDVQALLALEAVLKAMPESSPRSSNRETRKSNTTARVTMRKKKSSSRKIVSKNYQSTLYNIPSDDENESNENELRHSFQPSLDDESNDAGLDDELLSEDVNSRNDDESVSTTIKDPCVICYDSTIDCVLTPCGHQICCLQCSQNMSKCPICSTKCQSIRIFRP